MCYLLCLVWLSQMVLHQQAYCPQVALELNCCSQFLPTGASFSSCPMLGPGCALPHPWGIPHKLVHWDRGSFLQHIPYSPICPGFCGGPWRWLHGLELCLQPPRPLLYFTCHNFSLWHLASIVWKASAFLWAHFACSLIFCTNLDVFGAVVFWGVMPNVTSLGKAGLSSIHEIVWAEPCSWVSGAIVGMNQCTNVVLPLWFLLSG